MKIIISLITTLLMTTSFAAETKIKMYFPKEDILKIIEMYSKATGQKFVIDPSVRGQVSILVQEPVSSEEAFNQLSSALALNGFAISKQDDTMIIQNARSAQRNLIEVNTTLPSLKPQRMATWIYTAKNVPADFLNRELRILTSAYGEMSVNRSTNQIIFTDWTSNLLRISDVLKETDKKMDAAVSKNIESMMKERPLMHHKEKKAHPLKDEPQENQ